MTAPRITAIITSYNYGRFVGEAVESVLAQGFSPAELEVVVVDDGSTDGTPEQVRKFGSRIHYLRKANGGQASALNAGFENARGEIVALLDADDVWLPNKLRRVCEAFERRPDAIAVQHIRSIWNSENGAVGADPELPDTSRAFPLSAADLLRHGVSPTSAVAYRKSL
ncbi:MAG TPA: glycosyltransferase family A protein, partial [Candidatus Acidoferrales bacterium]|nr:glycosyltransferase family A protein [Candidatus Acidoferrales bacterium]